MNKQLDKFIQDTKIILDRGKLNNFLKTIKDEILFKEDIPIDFNLINVNGNDTKITYRNGMKFDITKRHVPNFKKSFKKN